MATATPLTINLWLAPAQTPCDEHQAAHLATYCVTWRKPRKGRAVLCVCRASLADCVDRLLGVQS